MVIVRLMGGLGNQMFQYAAGRRLAHARKTTLKVDLSFFATQSLRAYRLGQFNIQEQLATTLEMARMTGASGGRLRRATRDFLQSIKPYYRRAVIVERQFHFDRNILHAPANVYLDGYWQSEKYFADITPTIRTEFTLKHTPDCETDELERVIRRTNAVCVHIRGADYVSNPRTSSFHGNCGAAYYAQAARLITERCREPQCFAFSDDPDWVKENFHLDCPMTIIRRSGPPKDYEDLYLMSLCQHFIIANSTFGWWAAWLSKNPDKIVVAPRQWFAHHDADSRDLIPTSWLQI